MNFPKTLQNFGLVSILSLTSSLAVNAATGVDKVINKTVNASLVDVKNALLKFDSNLDFQFVKSIAPTDEIKATIQRITGNPPAEINALKIVKILSKQIANEAGQTGRTDRVYVVIQPTNLTEAKFYPRFVMDCNTKDLSTHSLRQTCKMLSEKTINTVKFPYALSSFSAVITAKENTEKTQTALVMNIKGEINEAETDEVMTAVNNDIEKNLKKNYNPVVANLIMAPVVAASKTEFVKNKFFTDFFDAIYEHWSSQIRGNK